MKKPTSKVEELREALKAKKEAEAKHKEPLKVEGPAPRDAGTAKTPEKGAAESRKEEEILDDLHAAEKEAKQHYDKLLRLMAEFENFKKRASREQEEHVKFANEKLMKELLPVLDDFDRVLDHVSEEKPSDAAAVVKGVELVRKTLLNALRKFGLSEIEAVDRSFDPNLHEAVSVINDPEREEDTVAAVHRKGYKLQDRVIRAAQVIVSKKVH